MHDLCNSCDPEATLCDLISNKSATGKYSVLSIDYRPVDNYMHVYLYSKQGSISTYPCIRIYIGSRYMHQLIHK